MSPTLNGHTADPCPNCLVESIHLGKPMSVAGRVVVGCVCDHCEHSWSRPVEDDVEVHDNVRVDLPEGTRYGEVWQMEADRIQIRGPVAGQLLWVERWQVRIY
ncbi:hypothetical protein [Streptomyces albipurpureus]|uniref:Uncharacterized protein n=1 Tax=Streptomyces albipurpureus TaxID=2897419 RepID=A0ABT0UN45_9ACTN|nr:hypothetical protein [Streptomyces sp. CWNU-1]MCM2388676.1 hypothetical protein [Streptomyces sp. CWNU-1]